MQNSLIILTLAFFSLTSVGQKQNIDRLISKLDNQQIVIMMQYVWYQKMFSPAGNSLIKIGNPATDKLISFLGGTSKGIIAHFNRAIFIALTFSVIFYLVSMAILPRNGLGPK